MRRRAEVRDKEWEASRGLIRKADLNLGRVLRRMENR